MKILTNILLSTNNNKLRLADIYFDNVISKIVFRTEEFEWSKISTKESWEAFKLSVVEEEYSLGNEIIDGDYLLAIPGAIDAHVHFNTPGFEFMGDFEHGSTAAAFGGVTTVIDMPCTSLPPVTSKRKFLRKLESVENRSFVDFAFWGGIRSNDFDDIHLIEKQISDLNELGVVGFKAYIISGMETFRDLSYNQLRDAAIIIEDTGKPLAVHSEDKSRIISTSEKLQNENNNSWKDYCNARDIESERIAVEKVAQISAETNCRTHVVHLSSEKGLQIIEEANSNGIPISAETCPHYLFFTQDDFKSPAISKFLKTAPPVKHASDLNALWNGLKTGKIKFVTTDHAGCNPKEGKLSKNFWKVYGGIPGVEHRVRFMFSEGFLGNKISLEQTIKLVSTNVAEFYNLPLKGKLSAGFDADIALINLWESEVIKAEDMHSLGKYTPFEGVRLFSKVEKTFLRGKLILDSGHIKDKNPGYGKFIKVG